MNSSLAQSRPRSRPFGQNYAFVVIGVIFVCLLIAAGLRSAPAVMMLPLEDAFGWRRDVISFAAATGILLYGLTGLGAYLLSRNVAIGAEYRQKPNNLGIAKEDDWADLFVAWAPTKHVSLTVAYADLGNIVIKDKQRGLYASVQVGF